MTKLRQLTFGALSLLTIATAAGCGNGMMLNAPQAGMMNEISALGSIDAAGTHRALGYDWARYENVIKPHAQPHRIPRAGQIPTNVDNRHFCSPVADQGQLGACTAFSIAKGTREYLEVQAGGTVTPLSPLFLYYQERLAGGTVNQDSGSTVTEGMAILSKVGVAPESDDPYNIAQFKVKPSAKASEDAGAFRVHSTTQLASLDDVKTAISQGHPVSFGFKVFASFRGITANGMMPVPKSGEQILGGHAVCAVGYDDSKQVLVVRNSWGPGWGDQGYFYMPYAVVQSGQADDFWTAQ